MIKMPDVLTAPGILCLCKEARLEECIDTAACMEAQLSLAPWQRLVRAADMTFTAADPDEDPGTAGADGAPPLVWN